MVKMRKQFKNMYDVIDYARLSGDVLRRQAETIHHQLDEKISNS
jgi:hypothetical protein